MNKRCKYLTWPLIVLAIVSCLLMIAPVTADPSLAITNCTPDHAEAYNASVPFTLSCTGFTMIPIIQISNPLSNPPRITATSVSMPDDQTITGTFDLRGARPGPWELSAFDLGTESRVNLTDPFTVDPTEFTINGTATDAITGQPLSGATITVVSVGGGIIPPESTQSDSAGHYNLTVEPDYEMGFAQGYDGYMSCQMDGYNDGISFVSGSYGSSETQDFQLTPQVHLAGYVIDSVTGQPVDNATVNLSWTSLPSPFGSTESDSDGYYRISTMIQNDGLIPNRGQNGISNKGVNPSGYFVTADKDGYLPFSSSDIDVFSDHETYLFNISLIPIRRSTITANFLALGHIGQAPYPVRFMDQSAGSPTAWLWDFGDGTTSDEQSPTHVYNQTGTYNVALTASTDQASDTCTQYRCIIVNTVPVAAFTANATAGQSPFTVQFTDQSTGGANGYLWQFGDGATSTEQDPVHTYTSPGSYTVTLTVSVPDYGSVFTQKPGYISVSGPSSIDLSANVTAGLAPLPVQFNKSVNGSVQYFFWHFGDGSTSTEPDPVHVYDTPGNYSVSLMAVSLNGTEMKTIENYIHVTAPATPTVTPTSTVTPTPAGPLPVANFTATADASGSLAVLVTDTSVNATTVRYDLGDGTTTAYRNFRYTYAQAGTYTIEQTATNAAGTAKKILTVTVPATTPTVTPTPGRAYNGPHTIPGTLQAEDYDLGGEGVAYHDTTPGNTGGAYRHDDVDIEQLDTDGSPNVGWIRSGEWLTYTVNVTSAGTYTAGFRVACNRSASYFPVYLDDNTTPIATVNVPNTGDWPVFRTVPVPMTLPAGQHRLRFSFPTDFANINWITFA